MTMTPYDSEADEDMKQCVSEQFLNYTSNRYPALTNRAYRKLFLYLCFGTFRDYETGLLVIPHEMLAKYCKRSNDTHFSSGKFLEKFKSEVLPNLEWTEHNPNGWYGKCRSISNDGFDDVMLNLLQEELTITPDAKYNFITGVTFNSVNKTSMRKTFLQEWEERRACFNLNPTQEKILTGLLDVSLSGKAFARKLVENAEGIEQAIMNLQHNEKDHMSLEEKQSLQRKILGSIEEDSRVFYAPTPLKRTPRLHHSSECVLSLKSAVRQAFCKGWVEADLVSSQFVILASLLDAPVAKAFIASGEHLWTYLNREATGKNEKPNKALKSRFKEIIYGICFGEGEEKLDNIIKNNGLDGLKKNEMIAELLDRRGQWFEKIRKEKSLTDVWGTRHYMDCAGWKTNIYGDKTYAKARWAGSLAATKIQSIEMEIISSVFDVQARHGENYFFQIMMFQHDGFTISINKKEKEQKVKDLMQEAIMVKAREVGLKCGLDLSAMKLEFNQL